MIITNQISLKNLDTKASYYTQLSLTMNLDQYSKYRLGLGLVSFQHGIKAQWPYNPWRSKGWRWRESTTMIKKIWRLVAQDLNPKVKA